MFKAWLKIILMAVGLTISLIMLLFSAHTTRPQHTYAQDNGQPSTPQNTDSLIHIVQSGENLLRIAELYGTTVEAIVSANAIQDERYIDVGQELVIPNPQNIPDAGTSNLVATNPELLTHTVQIGQTLDQIALEYQVPVETIAIQNNITNPNLIFSGQSLTIDPQAAGDLFTIATVQPDETVLHVAARFGVSLSSLQVANGWRSNMPPVFAGQYIIIPGRSDSDVPLQIVDRHMTSATLNPAVPKQGQSVSLLFETSVPVNAVGEFMGRPVDVATIDDTHYGTILGVHSFTEPAVYTLTVTLTDLGGTTSVHDFRIQVIDGGYGSEAIDIPPDREALLSPDVVQPELERVSRVMSGFSPQRYFDGTMTAPTGGVVTSAFGTRRSYNGSPFNTFHGGTDFGDGPGVLITAPADGVVVLATPLTVRGNTVIIDHGWGVYTGYWHQTEFYVTEGQRVTQGETIGAVGATGLVTGAHLHWEMWVGGVQVDPMQWVQQAFP